MPQLKVDTSQLPNRLEEIIKSKEKRLAIQKNKVPMSYFSDQLKVVNNERSKNLFSKALTSASVGLIAEVKRASPSKGIISEVFKPEEIARTYEKEGATAISVLTEEDYFMGSADIFKQVKAVVDCPLLRKDFIIDPYQIYESAVLGADAILLIACLYELETLKNLIELSNSLGLEVLLEIHDLEDLEKAVMADAPIIGVNNRNLKTFEVSIENSLSIANQLPKGKLWISESGIQSEEDIQRLMAVGYHGFLVGETLMRNPKLLKSFCEL